MMDKEYCPFCKALLYTYKTTRDGINYVVTVCPKCGNQIRRERESG